MDKAAQKIAEPLNRCRLWLYRFVAFIVIPLILLCVIEIGLRLADYGFAGRAIIKCQISGRIAYCDNIKFGWLFFPPNIAREFIPFVIPGEKGKNTYRIFVLGSSAAQGAPDSAYSFSRILDLMLSDAYPEVNFEVINAAMTAVNSHVAVSIAKDCAKYEPDLFVVYMGNNEVVGPYGPGTVFAPLSRNLSFIRLGIALRRARIGQLAVNLSRGINRPKTPKVWGGLGMFLDKQVSSEDQTLQTVYKNFRNNLGTIIKIADDKRIPVVLTTVGSNLKDCPPFSSLHRSSLTQEHKLQFDEVYQQGIACEQSGRFRDAIADYLAAEKIDSEFAELQFRLGNSFFLTGQYQQAKQRFIRALQLDTLRLRADSRMNEIIRKCIEEKISEGVYLADAASEFENKSPYQITGKELFYEHVHMNFKGNYLLAKTVFEQIDKLLSQKNIRDKDTEMITEEECKKLLAFTDWDKYRTEKIILDEYISSSPFTNQIYHKRQVNDLKDKIESLGNSLTGQNLNNCADIYRKAIAVRPDDWLLRFNFAILLSDGLEDYNGAAEQMLLVVQKVPHNYQAVAQLAIFLSHLGKYEEAKNYFNQALQIKQTDVAYFNLAVVFQKQDKFEDAILSYRRAVKFNPKHGKAWCNMTALLGEMKRFDEAIELCEEGLQNIPDDIALNLGLAALLILDGHKEHAIAQLNIVLELDPNHTDARLMLEKLSGQNK